MEKSVQMFRQYCKENSMRNTPERELIIKKIYRVDEHFDVERLFLRIRNRYPKLKRYSLDLTFLTLFEKLLVRSFADKYF
jgi:Fur family ferric uptake transcriptional regulator